ncbi:MAG: 4a-hydroxytetrahydrobiopterin dehydratase [Myxococcota bacterium]
MAVPPKLSPDEIRTFLEAHPEWQHEEGKLVRKYVASTDRMALRLIRRIGDLAVGAQHHPDLYWVYNRIRILLWTHDAGGLTRHDTHLAAAIEDVFQDG